MDERIVRFKDRLEKAVTEELRKNSGDRRKTARTICGYPFKLQMEVKPVEEEKYFDFMNEIANNLIDGKYDGK